MENMRQQSCCNSCENNTACGSLRTGNGCNRNCAGSNRMMNRGGGYNSMMRDSVGRGNMNAVQNMGCGCNRNTVVQNKGCACSNTASTREAAQSMGCGCRAENREQGVDCMPVGMGYVPWQQFRDVLDGRSGLARGTIFQELDLPFMCYSCHNGNGRRCD